MATTKTKQPAKPKQRKLSDTQLAGRIARDSAELAKRAGAAKTKTVAKPKATKAKAAPKK